MSDTRGVPPLAAPGALAAVEGRVLALAGIADARLVVLGAAAAPPALGGEVGRVHALAEPAEGAVIALAHTAGVGLVILARGGGPAAPTAEDLALARRLGTSAPCPVVHVGAPDPDADWIDGFEGVLVACAEQLGAVRGYPRHAHVAVVGYPSARDPDTDATNLAELRRLFGALGLSLVSVWFDGGPAAGVLRARDAGTVVSLPHGRRAARQLAQAVGARLVETDLPFGLDATLRFLYDVAAPFARLDAARAYAREALAGVVPRWERAAARLLAGRRLAWVGDPYFLPGFVDLAHAAGAHVAYAAVTAGGRHLELARRGVLPPRRASFDPELRAVLDLGPNGAARVRIPPDVRVAPDPGELAAGLDEARRDGGLDLVVGDVLAPATENVLRFGPPRGGPPTFGARGWLGFGGALDVADAMSQRLGG